MKRILVPTDFSKLAQEATNLATDMAKKMNAELILLHVIEHPSSSSFNVTLEVNHDSDGEDRLFTLLMIQKAKKQMAAVLETIKQKGVKVKSELRMGNPFHGMRTTITEQVVDLIIMGTEGHSKLEAMIVGSNTEKVIRHAHCPVLTISKKPRTDDFKNLVYATSLLKGEDKISKIITEIQEYFDATLHLVWINTPAIFQPSLIAKGVLMDFAKKQKLRNYTTTVFDDYTVEEGVIHFADSINADLIAMSTNGRTGFAHVLTGSIAEDVVNHARRPVLTYLVK